MTIKLIHYKGAALCICLSPSSSTSGKNKYIIFRRTGYACGTVSENKREKNELFDDNQNCA